MSKSSVSTDFQAGFQLLEWAGHESDPSKFLHQALPLVAQALGGEYAALVQGNRGRWRTIESSGPKQAVPSELLSEALDGLRWFQVITLFNPLTYVSEGLRAAMVPQVPHIQPWICIVALLVSIALFMAIGIKGFLRRALS